MIGYLDLPSGLSGDMFLGCLMDGGWPIERLRSTIELLKLPANEWSIEARTVQKAALRATLVQVKANEGRHRRNLTDISKIIQAADLPEVVQRRAIAVFARLAKAEAHVHGASID